MILIQLGTTGRQENRMTRNELDKLLAERGVLNMPAVEVGVAEGRFSEEILDWGVPFLYLVDLWASSPGGYAELSGWSDEKHNAMMQETIDRLANHEGKYKLLRGWSHEMCDQIEDGTLGFVFVDASHDYENALLDLRNYWPKLVPNGVMAGHDWVVPGVEQAVREFAAEKQLTIHLLPTADPGDISFWLEAE